MRTVTTDMQLEIGDLLMVVKDNVNMSGITHKGQIIHVSTIYTQPGTNGSREVIKVNSSPYRWTIENFAYNFALLEYYEKELYSVLFE